MIDRHYGHLARAGREHAIKLLDALNAREFDQWTLVDARWTPNQPVGVMSADERRLSREKAEALSRTRTADPLLTIARPTWVRPR